LLSCIHQYYKLKEKKKKRKTIFENKRKEKKRDNDLADLPSHNTINLYSEKYIRILQMLETQLKRNRKGNPLFYYSLSYLSFMALLCGHDSHHLLVLHISDITM